MFSRLFNVKDSCHAGLLSCFVVRPLARAWGQLAKTKPRQIRTLGLAWICVRQLWFNKVQDNLAAFHVVVHSIILPFVSWYHLIFFVPSSHWEVWTLINVFVSLVSSDTFPTPAPIGNLLDINKPSPTPPPQEDRQRFPVGAWGEKLDVQISLTSYVIWCSVARLPSLNSLMDGQIGHSVNFYN